MKLKHLQVTFECEVGNITLEYVPGADFGYFRYKRYDGSAYHIVPIWTKDIVEGIRTALAIAARQDGQGLFTDDNIVRLRDAFAVLATPACVLLGT
jgi:hypothetical protein